MHLVLIFAVAFCTVVFARNRDLLYSRFPIGQYYEFNGKLVCENGEPIGDGAKVALLENDKVSWNDFVDETKIVDGLFTVKFIPSSAMPETTTPEPTQTTTPDRMIELTPSLDLFLQFKYCCGYDFFTDKISGFLKNGTTITYTLVDGDIFAKLNEEEIKKN